MNSGHRVGEYNKAVLAADLAAELDVLVAKLAVEVMSSQERARALRCASLII